MVHGVRSILTCIVTQRSLFLQLHRALTTNLRPVVPLAQGNCNVLLFGNLMVQERDADGERFLQIRTLL